MNSILFIFFLIIKCCNKEINKSRISWWFVIFYKLKMMLWNVNNKENNIYFLLNNIRRENEWKIG